MKLSASLSSNKVRAVILVRDVPDQVALRHKIYFVRLRMELFLCTTYFSLRLWRLIKEFFHRRDAENAEWGAEDLSIEKVSFIAA